MSNRKSDEIFERLTKILKSLNENEELSIRELMSKMCAGLNVKTIERDLTERLISFPIAREKNKWRLQDDFKYENDKSIEDTVMLDMLDKMMKSGGPNFFAKGKKFLNPQNLFNLPFDLEDIVTQPKEVQKFESANKDLMFSSIVGNDKLIESPHKIKSYLDKYSVAHMKRRDDPEFYFCAVSDGQYIVLNKDVSYKQRYNSIEELVENSWIITNELFINHYSSL